MSDLCFPDLQVRCMYIFRGCYFDIQSFASQIRQLHVIIYECILNCYLLWIKFSWSLYIHISKHFSVMTLNWMNWIESFLNWIELQDFYTRCELNWIEWVSKMLELNWIELNQMNWITSLSQYHNVHSQKVCVKL